MATYLSPKSKAFQASCVVHAAFFVFLLVAAFWPSKEPKQKQHVFTLVSSSHPAPSVSQAEAFPSIKSPAVAQATVSEHKIPSPPKVDTPKPKEAKPAQVSPNKKLVSYDDFVKKHGTPKANITQQTAKPVVAPRISTKGFSSQLQQVLVQESTGGGWSSSSSHELSSYLAQLKDKLDAVWIKPQSLAKLSHLETQVEFTIEPNGLFNAIRVVGPSGQALFDDSVRQAFAKLHAAGRPPEGKRYSLRLTFKMEG